MIKVFSLSILAAGLALVPTGASLADPGLNNVARHQHYLVTPNDDMVPIGPDFCDDPDLQQAFNQFHYNIHHSGTQTTPVETLGPQDGAPGLHNDLGADMTAFRCS